MTDDYKALTREDVSDEKLLPERVELLRRDVREMLDILKAKLVPRLERDEQRIGELEDDNRDLHGRVNSIEGRLDALRVA